MNYINEWLLPLETAVVFMILSTRISGRSVKELSRCQKSVIQTTRSFQFVHYLKIPRGSLGDPYTRTHTQRHTRRPAYLPPLCR
ncbi:hypothetical protein J6590_095457 [Homalodisca vitripennis]|nr:hypothetical protein J6590_095457 [Homalodisca vitripennis]